MPSECYTAYPPSNCPRDSTELKEMVLYFRPDEKPENAFRTNYRVNWSDTSGGSRIFQMGGAVLSQMGGRTSCFQVKSA